MKINKRGGMELTTSTIVVIVIAIILLTLGIVFVKKVMCTAIGGIKEIDDGLKDNIQRLFGESNSKIVMIEESNEIPKNMIYNIAFGIKNEEDKTDTKFSYSLEAIDFKNCGITKSQVESYILTGKEATIDIPAGDTSLDLISLKFPKDAPLCIIKYQLKVNHKKTLYE